MKEERKAGWVRSHRQSKFSDYDLRHGKFSFHFLPTYAAVYMRKLHKFLKANYFFIFYVFIVFILFFYSYANKGLIADE